MNCPHPQRDHYAKGLCKSCYHKFGRSKKPWACSHERLYAKGLCQKCYINQYRAHQKNNIRDESNESEQENNLCKEEIPMEIVKHEKSE